MVPGLDVGMKWMAGSGEAASCAVRHIRGQDGGPHACNAGTSDGVDRGRGRDVQAKVAKGRWARHIPSTMQTGALRAMHIEAAR